MANHKLLFKRTYENRILTSGEANINTAFDFGEYNERQNIIGGTSIDECVAVIDLTIMWYDEGALSNSGAQRCVGVFACKNMQVDGYQQILCLDHQCEVWPACRNGESAYGNCYQEYLFYASRQPDAKLAGSVSFTSGSGFGSPWTIPPEHRQLNRYQFSDGVVGFNSIEYVIAKGSLLNQATYTDFFSVCEVALYEQA